MGISLSLDLVVVDKVYYKNNHSVKEKPTSKEYEERVQETDLG